jgi:hypothetical protein
MAVGRVETLIVFTPIAVVVTVVVCAFSSTYSENAARDVSARESGFDNYADQSRAKASGYVNAGDYKDAPVTRQIQRIGSIKSHAILGGLHHHYARA